MNLKSKLVAIGCQNSRPIFGQTYLRIKNSTGQKRFLYFGLNKLPLDSPLTPEVLITAVLTKKATHKAARDRTCDRLQQFANFAGIEIDLKPFKTGYSLADVAPKDPLNDVEIEKTISSISNPNWRYVFALMAVYGLRDHEAFLCKLECRGDAVVAIIPDDTKTGYHVAYPHPSPLGRPLADG